MAYSIVSKKRQAVAARVKPWLSTCGAVTEEGRKASSQNRTISGLHSREFLTIKRALNEAEALLAENIIPDAKDVKEPEHNDKGEDPSFAEEQETFFADEAPAFYANPNSTTQPTVSAGAE